MHSEQSIATGMAISRTPVREALLQLSGEGLVEFVPQRGVRVTELDAGHLGCVFQFRAAIKGHCAAALAALPRQEAMTGLDGALSQEEDVIADDDLLKWVEAEMEFHVMLVRSAGNPLLDAALAELASHSMRASYRTTARKERMRDTLAEHQAIYEAIGARDPNRARALVTDHLAVSALLMTQTFGEPGR